MLISWERFSSEYYWLHFLFQILSSLMLYFLETLKCLDTGRKLSKLIGLLVEISPESKNLLL